MLCRADDVALYHAGGERTFYRCACCSLVYVDPGQRLTPLHEVLRYVDHRNDASDHGYLRFLERLTAPLLERLPRGAAGLDFGCGPSPALCELMRSSGHSMSAYDPVFFPDEQVLANTYDFVTCSEVAEHAHDPHALFAQLDALTRPGGTIAVMTSFYDPTAPFGEWWYQRDRTHVSFFVAETMQWVARCFGWTVSFPAPNVSLFVVGTT